MPFVTVIIPNFNHAPFLIQRIDSVLNQTFQDFEVIILDDNSTDESQSIINSYKIHPQITHVLYNQSNSGSTFKQWNKGLDLAKGKFIWTAESDDFAEPTFLEKLIKPLLDSPTTVLSFCTSNVVDERSNYLYNTRETYPFFKSGEVFFDSAISNGKDLNQIYGCKFAIIPNASSVLFRKSAIRADETFKRSGDWKFWFDYMMTGTVAYINEPLNYFRRHSNAVTKNDFAQKKEAIILTEYFGQTFLTNKIDPSNAIEANFDWATKNYYFDKKHIYSFENIFLFLFTAKKFTLLLFMLKIKYLFRLITLKFLK